MSALTRRPAQRVPPRLTGIGRPAAKFIGGAGRAGHELGVIGIDPVRVEVLQLGQAAEIGQRRGVVEQILVRHHVGGFLLADGEVAIGLEIAAVVFGGKFDALDHALGVIEGAEHQSLAEIAVVDQVRRDLVIGVEAEIERGAVLCVGRVAAERDFLIDAGVEIMRALRQHRAVAVVARRSGRAVEQRGIGRRRLDQNRRREIARIAGMEAWCSRTACR